MGDAWGTCKYCGYSTDGGRDVCSDCYMRPVANCLGAMVTDNAPLPDNLGDAILWVIDEIWLGGGATTISIYHELDFFKPEPTKEQVRRRLASMVRRGVLVSADHIDYQYHEKRQCWRWTPCKIYYRPEER